jgi:hypothetical protein
MTEPLIATPGMTEQSIAAAGMTTEAKKTALRKKPGAVK